MEITKIYWKWQKKRIFLPKLIKQLKALAEVIFFFEIKKKMLFWTWYLRLLAKKERELPCCDVPVRTQCSRFCYFWCWSRKPNQIFRIGNCIKRKILSGSRELRKYIVLVTPTQSRCYARLAYLFPCLFQSFLFCSCRSRMLSDNPIETIEAEAFKLPPGSSWM